MVSSSTNDRPDGYGIGELSRRVGVSPETLRAWERRYALLEPRRTKGGNRVYSLEDELRVRAMSLLRNQGLAADEAARLARADPQLSERAGHGAVVARNAAPPQADAVLAGRVGPSGAGAGAIAPAPAPRPVVEDNCARLLEALRSFDQDKANRVLDESLSAFAIDEVLEHIILGALSTLGAEWVEGSATVGQEHFASNVLRGRLLELSRGWDEGEGPLALLACAPGELHDLALIVFGLALRGQGWRIAFLGIDTPLFTLAEAARELDPQAVVIASIEGRKLRVVGEQIGELADRYRVFLAGSGANRPLAARLGAEALEGEATYSARWLAAQHH